MMAALGRKIQRVHDQVEKASVAALLVRKMVIIAVGIVWTLRKVGKSRADPEVASVVPQHRHLYFFESGRSIH